MRRLLLPLVSLMSACLFRAPNSGASGNNVQWAVSETAALGPAPVGRADTVNSTGGLRTDGLTGFMVSVEAPSGLFFNGTGKLDDYGYSYAQADALSSVAAGWARNPALDLAMPAATSCSGGLCPTFTWPVLDPGGLGSRVYYQSDGIGIIDSDGGTGVCFAGDAGCPVTVGIDGTGSR